MRNRQRPSTTLFMGILNRVPSRMEKIYYRELRPLSTPPAEIRQSNLLSTTKVGGVQGYPGTNGYQSNVE
ncbi:unnamed protein product [Schistosoma margrebowiei]|nr:unnamed protein product [Schistosoma margrebowiei]